MAHYLIVGNGAAGLSAAEVIRRRDPAGRITIVTREPHLFYSRPGIAYYLTGQVPAEQLVSRDAAFYQRHRLDLRHDTVTALDLERHVALLREGGAMLYDSRPATTPHGISTVPTSSASAWLVIASSARCCWATRHSPIRCAC